MTPAEDPLDLERFVDAQDMGGTYEHALAELHRGRKTSHWMWFVFPQIAGLGSSPMARGTRSVLAGRGAGVPGPPGARAAAGGLRPRGAATDAIRAEAVFGSIDAIKLRSSMTLFARADPDEPVFGQVLDRFYGGRADPVDRRVAGLNLAQARDPRRADRGAASNRRRHRVGRPTAKAARDGPADQPLQGGRGERQPQERLHRPVRAEPRPGAIRTPTDGASRARSVANGPGSRTHSDVPPDGCDGSQSGRCAASAAAQRGRAGGQPGPLLGQRRGRVGQQGGHHQLIQHRAGHVAQRPGGRQPLDQAGRGAHPADPQPTPERLGHRPERSITLVEPVRCRTRPSAAAAGRSRERHVPERLVGQHQGLRRPRGRDHRLPGRPRPSASRSGSGSPGSGTPAGPPTGAGSPTTSSTSQAVSPGSPRPIGTGVRRRFADGVQRDRVGRAFDDHPVARPGQRVQHQGEGVLGAGGDQDLLGGGRHAGGGVPGGDDVPQFGQAERQVAVRVSGIGGAVRRRPRRRRRSARRARAGRRWSGR